MAMVSARWSRGHVRECLLDRRGRVRRVRADQVTQQREVTGTGQVAAGFAVMGGALDPPPVA